MSTQKELELYHMNRNHNFACKCKWCDRDFHIGDEVVVLLKAKLGVPDDEGKVLKTKILNFKQSMADTLVGWEHTKEWWISKEKPKKHHYGWILYKVK